jgi:hypothetical protein
MSAALSTGKGNWSIDEINANFKPTFENRSKNMYNSSNAMEGSIKKKFNFTGTDKKFETHLSYAGGYGARKLPKANNSKIENQVIERKKVYQRALVDREGLKAASNSQGSYQQYLKFPIKKAVENYVDQCGRITFGNGFGILGRGDAATDVTGNGSVATPYVVGIADLDDAVWQEKSFVQVVSSLASDDSGGTAEGGDAVTNLLEVVEVDLDASTVSLVGTSAVLAALVAATDPAPATLGFAHQRSYESTEGGEPMGLECLMQTSGSLYGIDIQRRWKATQIDADGSGILVDMVNEAFLKTDHLFGESPDMIVCRYNQYQKLLAQLEDKKTIMITNKNLKGHLGFEGIEYVSATGKKCSIVTNRFAKKNKVYLLNSKYIERHHAPGFGWFDEDGTVFMRETDEDQYEARYGGYWQHLIVPTAHAVIHNLAE